MLSCAYLCTVSLSLFFWSQIYVPDLIQQSHFLGCMCARIIKLFQERIERTKQITIEKQSDECENTRTHEQKFKINDNQNIWCTAF